MPENDSIRRQIATEHYILSQSPEWQSVIRHFEFAEGFSFVVLLIPDEGGLQLCRDTLADHLQSTNQTLLDISPTTPADLDQIATHLVSLSPPPSTAAIWMGAAASEAAPDHADWLAAWRTGMARLNQFRNILQTNLNCTLLFAGPAYIQPIVREMAPDLWSVRLFIAHVEPRPINLPSEEEWRSRFHLPPPEAGPDPVQALHAAASLRGKPGEELKLARTLHRAGKGLFDARRLTQAAEALQEALHLQRHHHAPLDEQAATAHALADSLDWLGEKQAAVHHYQQAVQLSEVAGTPLGRANALHSLGNLKRRLGDVNAASLHYQEALRLYDSEGQQLGRANALLSLGDLDRRVGNMNSARLRYQEALQLYDSLHDRLGLANSNLSLGILESRLGDLESARLRYHSALSLYEIAQANLGRANTLSVLGNLEEKVGEFNTARLRYKEALRIYVSLQDNLGRANTRLAQGDLERRVGNISTARDRYLDAFNLFESVQNNLGCANTLQSLSLIACGVGDNKRAILFLQQSAVLYEQEKEMSGLARSKAMAAYLSEEIGDHLTGIQAAAEARTAAQASNDSASIDFVESTLRSANL
ncbi:MAG: tetratricopeptide repeat protein [Bryobacterales bacterium]|nr:tetratricopeptide repeat protein [Bryobacterales bacterium]